jgi:hypothetical protein
MLRLIKRLFTIGIVGVCLYFVWLGYGWAVSAGIIDSGNTEGVDVGSLIVRYGVMLAVVVVVILVVKALIVRCTRPGATYWVDKK